MKQSRMRVGWSISVWILVTDRSKEKNEWMILKLWSAVYIHSLIGQVGEKSRENICNQWHDRGSDVEWSILKIVLLKYLCHSGGDVGVQSQDQIWNEVFTAGFCWSICATREEMFVVVYKKYFLPVALSCSIPNDGLSLALSLYWVLWRYAPWKMYDAYKSAVQSLQVFFQCTG